MIFICHTVTTPKMIWLPPWVKHAYIAIRTKARIFANACSMNAI